MKVISIGDSWAWGAELFDPAVFNYDLNMSDDIFKQHFVPENIKYREENRYIGLFAKKIQADEVVDLSQASCSNESIIRTLLRWLGINGYLTGKDTSELFVSIGFTSPERKEHMYSGESSQPFGFELPELQRQATEPWMHIGPWLLDYKYQGIDERVPDFLRLYVELFWNEREYLYRYYSHIVLLQNLLNNLKIKYIMHQAFYHLPKTGILDWSYSEYKNTVMNNIPWYDQTLWSSVDPVRFMLKDNHQYTTFRDYIVSQVDNKKDVFCAWHPNALGHKLWANYMYDYVLRERLC